MTELRTLILLSLALLAGCGARRTYVASSSLMPVSTAFLQLSSPIPVTAEHREETEDGILTVLNSQVGEAPSYHLGVVSLERNAPFEGNHEDLLLAVMGERVADGSLGRVNVSYSGGLLTAEASRSAEGTLVHVRAYMSRTRVVLVALAGRPELVQQTLSNIVLSPQPEELFFVPSGDPALAGHTDSERQVVWGLGFSCRMPLGTDVVDSPEALRYSSNSGGSTYVAEAGLTEDMTVERRRRDITARGVTVDDVESFSGGVRSRRINVQLGGEWHAWLLAPSHSFHVSGTGTFGDGERAASAEYFDSCVY